MLANKLNSRVNKGSGRIVWAFDPKYGEKDPFSKFQKTFNEIQEDIAAVKINRQLILPYGLKNQDIHKIISMVTDADIPIIMDAKINDIGYTNESIARNYFDAGFDAIICNPFVGEEGLKPIVTTAQDLNKDVIFLVYMSHTSADFGYGRKVFFSEQEQKELGKETGYYYELFAHLTNKMNAAGSIVGATYPEKIQEIRGLLKKDKVIISPGVGAQGGDEATSREMGMDYAIIGRAITENQNAHRFVVDMKEKLK